jgi:hypothetical protein
MSTLIIRLSFCQFSNFILLFLLFSLASTDRHYPLQLLFSPFVGLLLWYELLCIVLCVGVPLHRSAALHLVDIGKASLHSRVQWVWFSWQKLSTANRPWMKKLLLRHNYNRCYNFVYKNYKKLHAKKFISENVMKKWWFFSHLLTYLWQALWSTYIFCNGGYYLKSACNAAC